jgi:hypothetical protein
MVTINTRPMEAIMTPGMAILPTQQLQDRKLALAVHRDRRVEAIRRMRDLLREAMMVDETDVRPRRKIG